MIENINKLEKILDSFRFREPVPPDIQKLILSFKRKTVINTLKNFGEYNVVYGSVLRFYFFTKKIGINLTAWQAQIAFFIISAAATVIVLTGILFRSGILNNSDKQAIIEKEKIIFNDNMISVEKPAGKTAEKTGLEQVMDAAVKTRLGIAQIASGKEDEDLAADITDKLCNILKNEKSDERVIYRKTDGIDKSVNRLLEGRLNRVGNTYLLSISISSAETGKLLYDRNFSFKETDDIDSVIKNAAESISGSNEIW